MSDITVVSQPVIVEVSPQVYTVTVSSVGAQGATGKAATINVHSTSTGAAGTNATVNNVGDQYAASLDFVIPRGNTGAAATVDIYNPTITGAAGTNASVTNQGDSNNALFQFTIPRGNTGATGQGFTYRNAWVSGTSYAAYDVVTYNGSTYVCILAVSGSTIPSSDSSHWTLTASKGDTGAAATIDVRNTYTGAAGTNATVINAGSTSAALLDFTIPRGNTGLAGIVASATAPSDTTVVWLDTASAGATITTIDGGTP